MDNYSYFKKESEKEFDLGYGMIFINIEDKMNDFIDKWLKYYSFITP